MKKLKKSRFRDFRSKKFVIFHRFRLNFWNTCPDSQKMTLVKNTHLYVVPASEESAVAKRPDYGRPICFFPIYPLAVFSTKSKDFHIFLRKIHLGLGVGNWSRHHVSVVRGSDSSDIYPNYNNAMSPLDAVTNRSWAHSKYPVLQ